MKVRVVTPAPPRSSSGNRVTALRWARVIRGLGHTVAVQEDYRGEACDLLVALHARKSAGAVARFRDRHPKSPLVVALTGTDLYGDARNGNDVTRSLELASRVVLLQPKAMAKVPDRVRSKARVIVQSAEAAPGPRRLRRKAFEVCQLAHLRPVKDPFRAAMAARLLPAESRVTLVHAGAAVEPDLASRATNEAASNPRYRWVGDLPRWQALRLLARCRLMVLSSRMEGGANALSEALASEVPVVCSKVDGSVGLLGDDYPGYFTVGDTQALADLLRRAETDRGFYSSLSARCRAAAPQVDPAREMRGWRDLLQEIAAE
jgi:putative glycosyltransferase (TIGR04348 family)